MHRSRLRAALLVGAVVGSWFAPVEARAAFPGANGRIAFQGDAAGNREIYSMNPDGGGVVNLTHSPADDQQPDWSADGSRVVFASDRSGDMEIYSMHADGSDLRRLTRSVGADITPAWSPGMDRIVFASARNDPDAAECFFCDYDLFTMGSDGLDVRPLSSHLGGELSPEWSPDGTRIAFWRERAASGCSAIFTVRPDGSGLTQLTDFKIEAGDPDWSPDGTKLVFQVHSCSALSEIAVMNADGSGLVQLTRDFGNNIFPAWSPAGDRIVFRHGRNDRSQFVADDLFTMWPNGSHLVQLTRTRAAAEGHPDWQPRF